MDSFAFIVNPATISQLKDYWPMVKIVPDFIIRSSLKNIPPFKAAHISKIRSSQGKEIEGYIVLCPLLPELILKLEQSLIIDKLIAAAKIAEGLGVKIIGLNGDSCPLTEKAYKKSRIPFTNGNTLIAWSAFESIFRMAKVRKLNLKQSTVLIINATSAVGSLCAKKMAEYAGKIILSSENKDKLKSLKEVIIEINPLQVDLAEDLEAAAQGADVIINTTEGLDAPLVTRKFKPQAIVCDASLHKNLSGPGIIKAGLIKLPFPTGLGFDTGLPKDVIPAALAEVMLLTLKEKFTSYSLGDNINPDKLEEIANLAAFHGFEVWVPEAPVL